jgi:hypothetical protein
MTDMVTFDLIQVRNSDMTVNCGCGVQQSKMIQQVECSKEQVYDEQLKNHAGASRCRNPPAVLLCQGGRSFSDKAKVFVS